LDDIVIPEGSGPGGSLTDDEVARVYRKSKVTIRKMRARGDAPASFKVGRTDYTPPEAIHRDLQGRAKRAEGKTSRSGLGYKTQKRGPVPSPIKTQPH
jgi:hypothetical protein